LNSTVPYWHHLVAGGRYQLMAMAIEWYATGH